jgi:ribosomal protein S18 acetylase RimI-like enzyme
MASTIDLVDFDDQRADELIVMWRASFESALGIRDPHSLAQQRAYLLGELVPNYDVRVATFDSEIVGFVAASRESIAQLYVRGDFQRRGVGTQLLAWTKQHSNGSLWLYTFARNAGARAFYERHGFTATAFGFEPTWQLDDVRYEWADGSRNAA